MFRRFWVVAALAILVGGSGCTTPMRRADGTSGPGSASWAETPAPPQTQVTLPPERGGSSVATNSPTGLSKYFPGLRRPSSDPAASTASTARTPWFSLARRSKPVQPQSYTTDARSGLNPAATAAATAGVAALPVALQVPSDRGGDSSVTPTTAERMAEPTDLLAPTSPSSASSGGSQADLTSFNRAVTRILDDDVNPLPPAVEPEAPPKPVVSDRMPEIPAIDPRERPRLASPGSPVASADIDLEATEPPKVDSQAVNATPATPTSAATPDAATQAGFLSKKATTDKDKPHVHTTTTLASPQVAPSPQVSPTPQAKPTPQVVAKTLPKPIPPVATKTLPKPIPPVATKTLPRPTPQALPTPPAKPTPQALPTAQSKPAPTPQVLPTSQARPSAQAETVCKDCVCENCGAKIGKRPCVLKRIRQAIFDPDSMAPYYVPIH